VDALFHAQVERRPGALAVACGDHRLTFAELAARSQRLATRLRALGVAAERRVALIMDRSTDLAVATLAILGAGGAFVPLDPSAGGDRIRALAAAARADLTVTRASLRHLFDGASRAVVLVDEPEPLEAGAGWPGLARSARRLLYVMHTSGSTAAPRAVEVEHASSVDQILRLAGDLGLGPDDRHVHTAAIGFTLAVRQLRALLVVEYAVDPAQSVDHRRPSLTGRHVDPAEHRAERRVVEHRAAQRRREVTARILHPGLRRPHAILQLLDLADDRALLRRRRVDPRQQPVKHHAPAPMPAVMPAEAAVTVMVVVAERS